jgi:protease I
MRALIISADGFEDRELLVPRDELKASGFDVHVATPRGLPIRGKHGTRVAADGAIDAVDSARFDLLVLPGGKAPASLRKAPKVLAVAKEFMASGKPVAAVCHGPQILVSADLVRGRRVTSYGKVAPELKAAGARYVDEEVVVDGNLITSRTPADLPAFVRAIREATRARAGIAPHPERPSPD